MHTVSILFFTLTNNKHRFSPFLSTRPASGGFRKKHFLRDFKPWFEK